MSRWITITPDHLKAAGHAAIVDRAGTLATGAIDPVADAIDTAVGAVRGAVSAANSLDLDETKVPRSLKGETVRMALYALCERIGLELEDDQKKQKQRDERKLEKIAEEKKRVELPDVSAGSGEMQEPGAPIAAVNVPVRLTGRERTNGL